jgi:enamine deaminase RidA (YjgF/YER057c/UK114 family)
MERPIASPHRVLNPDSLPPPSGFSHAVVAAPGRTVYIAGQAGQLKDGSVARGTIAEQFEVAAGNVLKALAAAGGGADHLVSMQIFVTDLADYQRSLPQVGAAYRRYFGKHYPAIALLEVKSLFDPAARVELMCVAVIPVE